MPGRVAHGQTTGIRRVSDETATAPTGHGGAAGQAIQNFNVMYGFDQKAGLL